MNTLLVLATLACLIAAALSLYLASPHQKLIARALPARVLASAGAVLIVASLYLLSRFFGTATSAFILLTALMLLWSLPPLAIACLRHRPTTAQGTRP
ncbi:hypothetical protein [Parahaliea aestuarii]|uniref:Uncharacterized protein n=1 Tax=Parahaliea aestuarii TaxID=1852021 RepID=A0A5C9A3Q1_9GAMM|nr:hypothetical protein [Parahaliea aestuarii]TXS94400.1 hypothetical protein FVW59_00300 [Parahaliea aestuarii]